MKTIALFVALLAFAHVASGEPEKVILIKDGDVNEVNAYLSDGWTVKHQSAAASGAGTTAYQREYHVYFLFTLTPPSDEVLAVVRARKEAERKAAWERKKAEYQAKRQVEKP